MEREEEIRDLEDNITGNNWNSAYMQRQHSTNSEDEAIASGRKNFRLLISFPPSATRSCGCNEDNYDFDAHCTHRRGAEIERKGAIKANLVPCSCSQCRRGLLHDDERDWGRERDNDCNDWDHWDRRSPGFGANTREELRKELFLLDAEERYFEGKLASGGGRFEGKVRIRKQHKARKKTQAEKRKTIKQSKLSVRLAATKRRAAKKGLKPAVFFKFCSASRLHVSAR